MNKSLLLKILGILGGLFVVVGLFIPYVKVTGFSQSLWQTYVENKQIYLAIIIMIFGLLPIILFLINKKTEFSYTSVGALGFFLIIQIVDTVSNNTFNTLSFGFYVMLIGTILIGVITLLLDKKGKVNVLNEQIAPISNNISDPIERKNIDAIYDQNLNNSVPVEEPLTNTGNEPLNENNVAAVDNLVEPIDSLGEEIPDYQPENGVNPVVSEFNVPQEENNEVPEVNVVNNQQVEPVNVETVPETPQNINPTVELANEVMPQSVPEQTVVDNSQPAVEAAPQESIFGVQPEITFDEPQQTLPTNEQSEIPNVSQEPQVDIFGQPK